MTSPAPLPCDAAPLVDLLGALGMAVGVYDADGQPLYVNPPLCAWLAPDTAPSLSALLGRLLGEAEAATCLRRFREGRSLFQVRVPGGGLCRLFLRQAGERLLLALLPIDAADGQRLIVQEVLAAHLEASPTPVGILDDELRVFYLNPSARERLGISPEADLAAYPLAEIFPREGGERSLSGMTGRAAEGGPLQVVSPVRSPATGEVFSMEFGVMAHPEALFGHTLYCGMATPPAAAPGAGRAGSGNSSCAACLTSSSGRSARVRRSSITAGRSGAPWWSTTRRWCCRRTRPASSTSATAAFSAARRCR